jgi:hypothetical protein
MIESAPWTMAKVVERKQKNNAGGNHLQTPGSLKRYGQIIRLASETSARLIARNAK